MTGTRSLLNRRITTPGSAVDREESLVVSRQTRGRNVGWEKAGRQSLELQGANLYRAEIPFKLARNRCLFIDIAAEKY